MTFSIAVSLLFPFIRSNRIEFYFLSIRSVHGMAMALRNGIARTWITETVAEMDERKRNARNQA